MLYKFKIIDTEMLEKVDTGDYCLIYDIQILHKRLSEIKRDKTNEVIRLGQTIRIDKNPKDDLKPMLLEKGIPLTIKLLSALDNRGYKELLIIDEQTKGEVTIEEVEKDLSSILRLNFNDIEKNTYNYNLLFRFLKAKHISIIDYYKPGFEKYGIQTVIYKIKSIILSYMKKNKYDISPILIDKVVDKLSLPENINGLMGLFLLIEKYDKFDHSIEVMLMSLLIAKSVANSAGLDENSIIELGLCALLHDVGFIFVDDNLLKKQTALSEKDWKILQLHTLMGYIYLSDFETNITKASIIAGIHHHVKNSSSGYGILGIFSKMIDINKVYVHPLLRRLDETVDKINDIVSVVDKYVGIRKQKVYKEGKEEIEAIFILLEQENINDKIVRIIYKQIFQSGPFIFKKGQKLKMTEGVKLKIKNAFGLDIKKEYNIEVVKIIDGRRDTAFFNIIEIDKDGNESIKELNVPIDFSAYFSRLEKK